MACFEGKVNGSYEQLIFQAFPFFWSLPDLPQQKTTQRTHGIVYVYLHFKFQVDLCGKIATRWAPDAVINGVIFTPINGLK